MTAKLRVRDGPPVRAARARRRAGAYSWLDGLGVRRAPVRRAEGGAQRRWPGRVLVDEQNQPHPLVLGTDFELAGPYAAEPLPAPTRETGVDGYAVRLDGDLVAGRTSTMTVRITQGGTPVTNVEPYLGALAHLAAFHQGDLEVVHMHPQEAPAPGAGGSPSELMVHAEFPVAGPYRMFIQFQTRGSRAHRADHRGGPMIPLRRSYHRQPTTKEAT